MKSFWKSVLATMVGCILLIALWYVVMVVILIGSIKKIINKDNITVKENSVLYLNFDYQIPDYKVSDYDFQAGVKLKYTPALNEILNAINNAKDDDKIKGIYIETITGGGGSATATEIRDALLKFKESGKFIVTYSKSLDQSAYYIASVSDKIFINPEGNLFFKGLSGQYLFYKDMLDKLDINVHIFRPDGNKFKSAVEPYFLNKMSKESKLQTERYLNLLWNNMLTDISASRGISVKELNLIADNLSITSTQKAVELNMIDGAIHQDSAMNYIKSLLAIDFDKKINKLSVNTYNKSSSNTTLNLNSTDKIAVIYAQGQIIDGANPNGTMIADESLIKEIKKARKDDNVKAIVLRVNSPGGSALASELILRELELTKAKKPIIASYGNYAASGGYYISCISDYIVSNRNTLTGSIGVFGMFPNFEGLLKNKIGIHTDVVETNKNSKFLTPFSSITPATQEYMRTFVNNTYQTFLSHVADGRNLSTEYVDSIGQGRVWLGYDALNIKLVDKIGNLSDAIALAAEVSNIKEYSIVNYPTKKNFMSIFTEILDNEKGISIELSEQLGPYYQYLQTVKTLSETNGVQARLPYEIIIE